MASFSVSGTIAEIFDTQQVSEKFAKREFVVSVPDGQYPQEVKFQLSQDKCDLLDRFATGMEVDLQVNLRGRRYNKNGTDMFFNTLEVWKIEQAGSSSAPAATQQPTSANKNANLRAQPVAQPVGDESDSLPF